MTNDCRSTSRKASAGVDGVGSDKTVTKLTVHVVVLRQKTND